VEGVDARPKKAVEIHIASTAKEPKR
jgi:hypothetical protein